MAALDTLQIDTTPANVAAMMQRGQFHSWQDGRWRFSPYGGETVYVNDPTEHFTARAEFAGGYAAAVEPGAGLLAQIWADGTRGLRTWDAKSLAHLWLIYGPKNDGERRMRDWILAAA